MRVHISPRDGVPIYLQIVQQVRRLVASGELMPGDELPSIRSLADTLVINPNTVAHAYKELESLDVVTSSRGLGTYVREADQSTAHAERRAVMAERVDALVLESRQMRIPFEELLEMMHERNSAFRAKDEETGNESGVICG